MQQKINEFLVYNSNKLHLSLQYRFKNKNLCAAKEPFMRARKKKGTYFTGTEEQESVISQSTANQLQCRNNSCKNNRCCALHRKEFYSLASQLKQKSSKVQE